MELKFNIELLTATRNSSSLNEAYIYYSGIVLIEAKMLDNTPILHVPQSGDAGYQG